MLRRNHRVKAIHKLVPKRKSSKVAKAAKILVPVAGAVAAKHLWDTKGKEALGKAGTKVLDATEEIQEKVQKFHDLVENSMQKAASAEEISNEETEENEEAQETTENMHEKKEGQENGTCEENEKKSESSEEISEESEKSAEEKKDL